MGKISQERSKKKRKIKKRKIMKRKIKKKTKVQMKIKKPGRKRINW